MWFAVVAPAAVGALVFFGALALGQLDSAVTVGPVAVTPLLVAIAGRARRRSSSTRPSGSAATSATARWPAPPAPGRPAAPPRAAGARPERLAAAGLAARAADGLGGGLPRRRSRSRSTSCQLPAVGGRSRTTSCGTASRPATPGRRSLELTAPDVRLPQRPDLGRTRPRRRGGPGRSTSSRCGSTRTASPAATSAAIYDAGNLVIWWLGVVGARVRVDHGVPPP